MSNVLKHCGCRSCKAGMHRGSWGSFLLRRINRKLRHQTKDALRKGEEPPKTISVPYTD